MKLLDLHKYLGNHTIGIIQYVYCSVKLKSDIFYTI